MRGIIVSATTPFLLLKRPAHPLASFMLHSFYVFHFAVEGRRRPCTKKIVSFYVFPAVKLSLLVSSENIAVGFFELY
jgi:hypothetical protein